MGCSRCMKPSGGKVLQGDLEDVTGLTSTLIKLRYEQ
jgi:hypothetical protein